MAKRNEIEKLKGPEMVHIMNKIDELVDAVNDIYRRFQRARVSLEKMSFPNPQPRKRSKNV